MISASKNTLFTKLIKTNFDKYEARHLVPGAIETVIIKGIPMKHVITSVLIALFFSSFGCSNVSPDAVDLEVDFSWEGMVPCSWGIPEIGIKGVPENTKYLVVSMYDHAYFYDHGEVRVAYNGSNIIAEDSLKEIYCPCPPDAPGRYKITVKAIDDNEIVIGVGSKERYFPEEK